MHEHAIMDALSIPRSRATHGYVSCRLLSPIRRKDRFCQTGPGAFGLLEWDAKTLRKAPKLGVPIPRKRRTPKPKIAPKK